MMRLRARSTRIERKLNTHVHTHTQKRSALTKRARQHGNLCAHSTQKTHRHIILIAVVVVFVVIIIIIHIVSSSCGVVLAQLLISVPTHCCPYMHLCCTHTAIQSVREVFNLLTHTRARATNTNTPCRRSSQLNLRRRQCAR